MQQSAVAVLLAAVLANAALQRYAKRIVGCDAFPSAVEMDRGGT
jgi:hypothetical protein